jgi:methionyl-tRNA synthetase
VSEPFYITTPIYYVNAAPHLGHAYSTILADAFARYHRARGQRTWFLTGTDEHGEKIEEAAQKAGVTPIQHADAVVAKFKEMWKTLNISNDDFIRTTEERHKRVVQQMWNRLKEKGDIYLGEYEGWYCTACETFYTELQLNPGRKCPIHETEVRRLKETTYFFKMSKYEQALLDHIEKNPDFVRPESRRKEIVAFIKGGLRDLSVSRSTFTWGIPVPNEPGHVIYVWIDALTNYMSALDPWEGEKYKTFWPHTHHLIGKDIIRHHVVYWPTMLLAAGLPLPQSIVVTGWWSVRGQKISKSFPATRIDPATITREIGNDGLRYFLLREIPLGGDGDFVYESLIGRWNSELANDLGNLVNRTIGMAKGELAAGGRDAELEKLAADVRARFEKHMDAFEPSRALEALWELVRAGNNYIAQKEPFRKEADERAQILSVVAEVIRWVAMMVAPVLPETSPKILAQLGLQSNDVWPAAWGYPGSKPSKAEPMFPKIDDKRQAELLGKWLPPDAQAVPTVDLDTAKTQPVKALSPEASIDDFKKLDFRVAVIKAARKHPKADKLLHLDVDAGEGRLRSVVAGIAEIYSPDELVGRRVILLANLKPATIRGILSEGMILAAGEEKVVALSALDRDAQPGEKIR